MTTMGHNTSQHGQPGFRNAVVVDIDMWRRTGSSPRAVHDRTTSIDRPSDRSLALLRAVAAGRAELTCSRVPDFYVDGLCCCNQDVARELVRRGLIHQSCPGRIDQRVRAVLTDRGRAMLDLTSERRSA